MISRRLALHRIGLAAAGLAIPSAVRGELPARRDTDEIYNLEVDRSTRQGVAALEQAIQGDFLQRAGQGRNPGIVGLTGLSLLSVGGVPGRGPLGHSLDRILEYVIGRAGESGFIHDAQSRNYGPMYEHGFATLMLCECYGMTGRSDLRGVIEQALDLIFRSQNERGGWRYHPAPTDADLSVTVCQMMALRAARNAGFYVPAETVQKALDYVKRCQNTDGGFAYQITGGPSRWPLTAAAIVALQNAGAYEGDELERAYSYLTQRRREVAIPMQTNYFFYAHYYGIQAFWQRGGDAWNAWYKDLRDTLLRLQMGDGMWMDYTGKVYGTAMACLVLSAPRSVLPIFQR